MRFYGLVRLVFNNSLTKPLLLIALTGILVSCGSNPGPLRVRQFHLRDTEVTSRSAQFVRGEQLYRLNGAVTQKERENRKGSYYTMSWNTPQAVAGDMKIIFEYQQAATASKVLTMTRNIPAGQEKGSVEFNIIGQAYLKGGNVLAWRARLVQDGKVVATQRSYLWKTGN